MGVLDPLKIAAMSLKAQKQEDHTRLKVELEEQFSKLLLSLKTNLMKKALKNLMLNYLTYYVNNLNYVCS